MPGFPRGAAARRRTSRGFLSPRSTRHVKAASFGSDLLAAFATGAGIVFWGGVFVLLAG